MRLRFRLFFLLAFVLGPLSLQAQDSLQEKADSPQAQASTVVGVFEREDVDDGNDEPSEISTNAPAMAFLFDGGAPTSIEQLRLMETRFKELSEKLFPATVNIQVGQSQGSGVVVSGDGYILTAAHVIGGPGKVARVVFPDGKRYQAETLGVNVGPIDSGMLKIKNKKGEFFPYIDLGVSNELKAGQWVMAVGHPGGRDAKRGLVTRVGRIVNAKASVLLTDCTLVGGDSGGPLIDMNGKLIGIHSRIGRSLIDNLHVPVDQYSENWDKLAQGLLLHKRPYLGISMEGETNKIKKVTEKKAADKAGVKDGDVLTKIGEFEIESRADIPKAIKELGLLPRQKIKITVLRDGEEKQLALTVDAQPDR